MITLIWKNLFSHHVTEKKLLTPFSNEAMFCHLCYVKFCYSFSIWNFFGPIAVFFGSNLQVSPKYENIRFECEFWLIFLEELSPRLLLWIEWTPRLHYNPRVRSSSSDLGMFLRVGVSVGVPNENTTSLTQDQTRDTIRSESRCGPVWKHC